MNADDIRRGVVEALSRIAPEVDAASLRSDLALREQLDLDSMDFLSFVRALHQRYGIDIPEADYPRVSTLDAAVAYVAAKLIPATSARKA